MTQETEPILIGYEKEINRRAHARKPAKTIRANVIIFVHKSFINFFNVPVYQGEIPYIINVKACQRREENNLVAISEHQRAKSSLRKAVRLVKVMANKREFLINFPKFFNYPMIKDSLYLIMKANLEIAKFCILPSRRIRSIFIGNNDMVQVFIPSGNKLAEPRNADDNPYGTVTLVEAPVKKTQQVRMATE